MKMIKKILVAALVAIPMFASAQTVKIGLVDTNALIAALPETTQAQQQIADISKKYDEEYQKLGEEMNRLIEEFKKSEATDLPAIRERKTRELTDYQQKLQQFEQNAMQDLQKQQNDLMAPILTKVRTAISAVGKEGGYTLIQDNNPQVVLYFGAPAEDITSAVKVKLNVK